MTSANSKSTGRPASVAVFFSRDEVEAIRREAHAKGLSMSGYIRLLTLERLQKGE